MSLWLESWALLGLPLAAVPLLLHLLQRRTPPTVEFPAVRYLTQVAAEHRQRFRLRHLLLLAVRTMLLLALVLAAAGPSLPLGPGGAHAPGALVIILDDSPSSGAVIGGSTRFEALRASARRLLRRATAEDRLWLITGDGTVRSGSAAELDALIAGAEPGPYRMDLGQAVTLGTALLGTASRPGGIVVLSDLQASAFSKAAVPSSLVIGRLPDTPPANGGVEAIELGATPWSLEGGRVTIRLGGTGDSGRAVPLSLALGDRAPRRGLVVEGGTGEFQLSAAGPGWWPVRAVRAPDELRADDGRAVLVRVVAAPGADWNPADRYVAAASEVLAAGGRLRRGGGVMLGPLGPGPSLVVPPADPAAVGALNRALERRGIGWRFGAPVSVAAVLDSSALVGRERVSRRLALEARSATRPSAVLATVGGEPWLVRSGDVMLIGSRLEPEWTSLPLSTGFLPFLDAVIYRAVWGDLALLEATPGATVMLPEGVTEVRERRESGLRWQVEGGAGFRAPGPGLFFLLDGGDTVGALSVNLDSRESRLTPASAGTIAALWPGARIADLDEIPEVAFAAAGRTALQAPLLWMALLLGVLEVALGSGAGRRPVPGAASP